MASYYPPPSLGLFHKTTWTFALYMCPILLRSASPPSNLRLCAACSSRCTDTFCSILFSSVRYEMMAWDVLIRFPVSFFTLLRPPPPQKRSGFPTTFFTRQFVLFFFALEHGGVKAVLSRGYPFDPYPFFPQSFGYGVCFLPTCACST